MNTHNWTQAKKSHKLTRGEWINSHLCLRFIQNRWQVNEYQNQEQIDLRFLSMMDGIEHWIKPLSDEEMFRLLDMWIQRKKTKLEEIEEKRRIDAIRQEEDSKRWMKMMQEIEEIDNHKGIEVIE
jgi:hypothetical protein